MSFCIFEKILHDAHNGWMTDRHQANAYPLRLPTELKAQVAKAAFVSRRSFNAEVTARLSASFQVEEPIPSQVRESVFREIERHGGSTAEALTRLVQAGEHRSNVVLNLHIQPGTTLEELSNLIQAARNQLPLSTVVIADTQPFHPHKQSGEE